MALNTQPFNANPKTLGVDIRSVDTTQKHDLGLEFSDNVGNVYKYMKFTSVVADKEPVKFDANFLATIAASSDRVQGYIDNGGTSTANPSFAWVKVAGIVLAAKEITTGVLANDPLSLLMTTGKMKKVPDATTGNGAGAQHVRAVALANEATNLADLFLLRA